MLITLGIDENSVVFKATIDELIEHGLRLSNCMSSVGRIVLPLEAKLWGSLVEHVSCDQWDSSVIASLQSGLELEMRNCGMLDQLDSKKVRVEDGESIEEDQDCAICLEELLEVDGSVVSELPCFHIFHEDCIEKWLKKSLQCPICRFELST